MKIKALPKRALYLNETVRCVELQTYALDLSRILPRWMASTRKITLAAVFDNRGRHRPGLMPSRKRTLDSGGFRCIVLEAFNAAALDGRFEKLFK